MKDNSIQSRTVEWLRFPCAFLVVMLHAVGAPLAENGVVSYKTGIYDVVRIMFSNGICGIAVPFFFVVSAYFFYSNLDEWDWGAYLGKLKKKCKTLLLPYFLWCTLAIIYGLAIFEAKSFTNGGGFMNPASYLLDNGIWHFYWDSNGGLPADYPLWFIRNLILLNILSPLFFFIVKKLRVVGLCAMYILFTARFWTPPHGFEPECVFFFYLGAYLRLTGKDMVETFRRFEIPSYILAVVFLCLCVFTHGEHPEAFHFVNRQFTLFGTMSAFCIASRIVEKDAIRMSPFLTGSSFFIFAAHALGFLGVSTAILNRCLPFGSQIFYTLRYLLTPVLTVSLVLAVYWVVKRTMPKTTALFTGSRDS